MNKWTLADQREYEEAARSRGHCDTCRKIFSRNQTILFQADLALCLDCVIGPGGLAADDRVEVSVDLLRRLKDGVL